MTQAIPDDLWRDFPRTATEFEARFATEEDCRAYWMAARWGGARKCRRRGPVRLLRDYAIVQQRETPCPSSVAGHGARTRCPWHEQDQTRGYAQTVEGTLAL